MNKLITFAVVASFALTSCKKNYTCECTYSATFPNYPVTTDNKSTGQMKKSDAEKKCDEGDKTESKTLGLNTYEYTTECALK